MYKLLAAGAVMAGSFTVSEIGTAHADTVQKCTYTILANTGAWRFENETGITVEEESRVTGIPVDELFNRTTLPIPCKTGDTPTPPTSTPESKPASTPAPAATDKSCVYNVISQKETANLLSVPGKTGKALCDLVVNFQKTNGLVADGAVGKITGKTMITKSANACNIYGTGVDDCFLGLQEAGNLGSLYTIKDGKVVRTMPARFGNPAAQLTPEGAYPINRSVPGDHAGSNCKVVNGVREKCMRKPLYFAGKNGGIAVHGTSNPQNPNGSMGCIGVSNANSDLTFTSYAEDGIKTVVVVDFQRNK